jgi:uncharacterized protein YdaU (DUF1376 family)
MPERDLTWFPLYVHRVKNSEACEAMSAEEFGCYMRLLIHAWIKEKDSTVPDDKVALARICGVAELSERVLEQFPTVETAWGTRRRNSPQFGVWEEQQEIASKGRNAARAAAKERWRKEHERREKG